MPPFFRILISYFIILLSLSYPQNRSIVVEGNKIFSDNELISWAEIPQSVKWKNETLDSALKHIALNLSLRGYFHSNFNGSSAEYNRDSSQVIIKLLVNEGQPTYIKNIFLSIEAGGDSVELYDAFKFLEGSIFEKSAVENTIDLLLSKFENNGYPFAKIKISSINFIDDSSSNEHFVNLHITINRNIKSAINQIDIRGNDKTNDNVIVRELRIAEGELYSQNKIESIPSKLNKLRFFEPVSLPNFYLNSKNEGVLQIDVKEKQTNNFDGIVGYIPASNGNEKGYITGLINVSLRNMFGTGRAAAIRWQKLDRNSQELELKYLEPWIFSLPFNFSTAFNQRKQDSTFVQRKFEGSIEFLATESISALIQLGTESVIPTENSSNVFSVYNSNTISTGLTIKIDTRDDPYSPTEGIYFNNTYLFNRKKINGPLQFISPDVEMRITLQKFLVGLELFHQIFKRQVAALKLNGKELQGSSFEISDLFRLGGTNSLRGYREDQFLGNRVFWSNLEYRLLLTPRTFTFLFFDTGYFLVKENITSKLSRLEQFNFGYGLGLNIETSLGIIGVSFALAKGDSFSDGKIHFGLLNEF